MKRSIRFCTQMLAKTGSTIAQPSGIDALALFTIDLGLHLIDQVRLLGIHLNGKIPARSIRLAQTARPQRTGGAVFDAGAVDIIGSMAVAWLRA